MRKILLIVKHEVITTVTRRSFLFTALGLPLISSLAWLGVTALNRTAPGTLAQVFRAQAADSNLPEGFVDQSGLVKMMPSTVPVEAFRSYPTEDTARQALASGEISAYYLIPVDYLLRGEIIYIRPDFNPLSAFDQTAEFERILTVNLLEGDESLAAKIDQPMNLQEISLAPIPQRDEQHPLTFLLPYGATMILYVMILMSASLLLNSLAKEKENRVLEILMLSATPRQLLQGKIIGLGLAGLFQTTVWMGTGYGLLQASGRAFNLSAAFQLAPAFLGWGVLFFALGYALYASLMAGVGALVPNLREASQVTFVVILPLVAPLIVISVLIEKPNGALATGLSLFPLTAPVVMITRLAATSVPTWQILLAAAMLVVTAGLVVNAVARLFRAQVLLAGQPFSLRRLVGALSGK